MTTLLDMVDSGYEDWCFIHHLANYATSIFLNYFYFGGIWWDSARSPWRKKHENWLKIPLTVISAGLFRVAWSLCQAGLAGPYLRGKSASERGVLAYALCILLGFTQLSHRHEALLWSASCHLPRQLVIRYATRRPSGGKEDFAKPVGRGTDGRLQEEQTASSRIKCFETFSKMLNFKPIWHEALTIITRLQPLYMPEPRSRIWKEAAEGFYERLQFPNCVGSVDGKHVTAKCRQIVVLLTAPETKSSCEDFLPTDKFPPGGWRESRACSGPGGIPKHSRFHQKTRGKFGPRLGILISRQGRCCTSRFPLPLQLSRRFGRAFNPHRRHVNAKRKGRDVISVGVRQAGRMNVLTKTDHRDTSAWCELHGWLLYKECRVAW
ncbi:hypothetical protein PR048_005423 [Dryococelus australis]|uniref:Transposase n=1 Tax=Dryococelus australis TaxID=614101 RepID=A0ABQ9I862_9NEOP|nr:hypothetical protein PR048_005423 [Dryococelus australis]